MNTYEIKLCEGGIERVNADRFEFDRDCYHFYVGQQLHHSYPVAGVVRIKRMEKPA